MQDLGIAPRALSDITSVPEVRRIFKTRTVLKPDVFLPERRTFSTAKNRTKFEICKFFSSIPEYILIQNFQHQICVQEPYLKRINKSCLVCISPDLVQYSMTCPANLGVWSCLVRKLICPVRLSSQFSQFLNLVKLITQIILTIIE